MQLPLLVTMHATARRWWTHPWKHSATVARQQCNATIPSGERIHRTVRPRLRNSDGLRSNTSKYQGSSLLQYAAKDFDLAGLFDVTRYSSCTHWRSWDLLLQGVRHFFKCSMVICVVRRTVLYEVRWWTFTFEVYTFHMFLNLSDWMFLLLIIN
jgi:hypothetical protein